MITQRGRLRHREQLHDFVDGARLDAGRQHQRRSRCCDSHLVQQAQAARELRIARAGARGVDQHELLAATARPAVRAAPATSYDVVRGDAEQASQHVHLFVRADAHRVGRHQRDAARAVTQHPARGELGEQRGLAGAGGTGEGDAAAGLEPAIAGDLHGARDGREREAARRGEIRGWRESCGPASRRDPA